MLDLILPNRKSSFFFWSICITAGALALAGCRTQAEAPQEPTPVPLAVKQEAAQVVEPQPVEPTPVQSECLVCHQDKQMLIDTARPEEEVVVENEGVG